ELRAQLTGVAVHVSVQPAPRRVRDRVDDGGRRVCRPGRLRQVQRLHAGERLALALVGLRAQALGDLLLAHRLELPVVGEQPHQPWRGAIDEPSPPTKTSQNRNAPAPTTAVTANTRPMAPLRWSTPAARRTTTHA